MTNGKQKIFFSGIGGSGMSALACFAADRGATVTGSDRAFDQNPGHPVRRMLRAKGITLVPQDGKGIDVSLDLVVFSTAVEPDRPEAIAAKAVGVPTKTRPEYLADIVSAFRTVAVAGTSGKSTTAGMLAFLMERLGLKPNFIGGGRVKQFMSAKTPGNSLAGGSDLLVIEACESDGTIVNYRPLHSVILNLELDHHSLDVTAGMFRTLVRNTSGKVIVNADDPGLEEIGGKEAVTFSIETPSDYRATDIAYKPFGTDFRVGNGRFALSLPGRYNLSNALSCIAVLSELGVPPDETASVLREFTGIERRFDVLLDRGGCLVIDDYAHNPHKISALMETVRTLRESVCYIFQPHGFAPTKMMKDEYIDAFTKGLRDSDRLILLPIFYAGGTVRKDISSEDLAAGIRKRGRAAEVVETRDDVLARVGEWEGYVILGARDETLSGFAAEIARLCSGKK